MTSSLSTHVLDAVTGTPAAGVHVTLYAADDTLLDESTTNADGRIPEIGGVLEAGNYRLSFATGAYFAERSQPTLYPVVTIDFTVSDGGEHYHVPLLLSPFAYSTYRGS